MAKNRWALLMAALCMALSTWAQFPGGFRRFKTPEQIQAQEAEKDYQKGNEYLNAKKLEKAFAAYEKAATAGHAGAQYNLGTFYLEGKVVAQDANKAVNWFEKAAKQGLKDAQYNLAAIYHNGLGVEKDPQKAEYWAKIYKDIEKLPEPEKPKMPMMGRMPNFQRPPVAANGKPKEDKPTQPIAPDVDGDGIYEAPEQPATFPGGEQALFDHLQEKMAYPSEALKKRIQGRVMVQFVVNTDGSINEVTVLKSVHPSLDKEAMRVIKGMPKWNPAMQEGKPVRMRYTLPISFKLQ